MANANDAMGGTAKPQASLLMGVIVPALVATVIAAGAGFFFGMQIVDLVKKTADDETAAAHAKPADKPKEPDFALVTLPPVLTTLAEAKPVWVRIESILVYSGPPGPEANAMAAKVAEDLVAYLKVTSLAQIEGASGFQHLRDDINERARIRGAGKVRDIILQSLIVE